MKHLIVFIIMFVTTIQAEFNISSLTISNQAAINDTVEIEQGQYLQGKMVIISTEATWVEIRVKLLADSTYGEAYNTMVNKYRSEIYIWTPLPTNIAPGVYPMEVTILKADTSVTVKSTVRIKPLTTFTDFQVVARDTNNDSTYDIISLIFYFTPPESGHYNINASFRAGEQTIHTEWGGEFRGDLNGTTPIELIFSGIAFSATKYKGTLKLAEISIYHNGPKYINITYRDLYTTGNFDYEEFEAPYAELIEVVSDTAIDEDGDGYFDYLTVTSKILVTKAGKFSFWSDISDIGSMNADITLSPGTVFVELKLEGDILYSSEINGAYWFSLTINGHNPYYRIPYENIWETKVYNSEDFQRPAVTFTGSNKERLIDIDNDKLIDSLLFDIGVHVAKAGEYQIHASVYDSIGVYLWSGSSYKVMLDTGLQYVTIALPGTHIRQNNINGPYNIRSVRIQDSTHIIASEYDFYKSQPYDVTTFEMPIVYVKGFRDYGLDTNNDGLYDFLIIEVIVQVSTATNVVIEAELTNKSYKDFEIFMMPTDTVIILAFDGKEIYNDGINGPYELDEFEVKIGGYRWWLRNEYYTQNYSYTEFQSDKTALPEPQVHNLPIITNEITTVYNIKGQPIARYRNGRMPSLRPGMYIIQQGHILKKLTVTR